MIFFAQAHQLIHFHPRFPEQIRGAGVARRHPPHMKFELGVDFELSATYLSSKESELQLPQISPVAIFLA
jgi:hypothetical protein